MEEAFLESSLWGWERVTDVQDQSNETEATTFYSYFPGAYDCYGIFRRQKINSCGWPNRHGCICGKKISRPVYTDRDLHKAIRAHGDHAVKISPFPGLSASKFKAWHIVMGLERGQSDRLDIQRLVNLSSWLLTLAELCAF